MEFKFPSNRFSGAQVVLSPDELGMVEVLDLPEAEQALRQISFEFAMNNPDISKPEFGHGVLSSIGYVATARGNIQAGDWLSRGFSDGVDYCLAKSTVTHMETIYSLPQVANVED